MLLSFAGWPKLQPQQCDSCQPVIHLLQLRPLPRPGGRCRRCIHRCRPQLCTPGAAQVLSRVHHAIQHCWPSSSFDVQALQSPVPLICRRCSITPAFCEACQNLIEVKGARTGHQCCAQGSSDPPHRCERQPCSRPHQPSGLRRLGEYTSCTCS